MEIEPTKVTETSEQAYQSKVRKAALLNILEQASFGNVDTSSAFEQARKHIGEELMVILEAENLLLDQ